MDENNDIVAKLKGIRPEPWKRVNPVGLVITFVVGLLVAVGAGWAAASLSSEEMISGFPEYAVGMTKEEGPLGFIMRIAGSIAVLVSPIWPLIQPGIFIYLLAWIGGLILGGVAVAGNFFYKKVLMAVIVGQGIVGAAIFTYLFYQGYSNLGWMNWIVLVVGPILFVLSLILGAVIIIKEFDYCSACGKRLGNPSGKLITTQEAAGRLLRALESQDRSALEDIEFKKGKLPAGEYLELFITRCTKDDEGLISVVVNKSEYGTGATGENSVSAFPDRMVEWFKTFVRHDFGSALLEKAEPA
jgi:hypothetical protein